MVDVRKRSDDVATSEARHGEPRDGLVLLIRGAGGVLAVTLDEAKTFTIGRGTACDVVVDDESVSRRHVTLSFRDGWHAEDAGSRNGTSVDGRKIRRGQTAPIAAGSVVKIGSATAVLQAGSRVVPSPESERAPLRRGKPRPTLPPDDAPAAHAPPPGEYVARDPAMRRLYDDLDAIAPSPLSVLIVGETGVGKELFAGAIHARSTRAARPIVQINCAAIPAGMLESELFGFERGAFTGAAQAKPGLFETAEGGTVVLDELGELPLALQAKLLRVLETKQVQRLGAVRPRAMDVRIVSSTNRDLRAAVANGEFRADLYHRLNGVSIRIPPLRERPSDIVPLAVHFSRGMALSLARAKPAFSPDAEAALERHAWPGNVRELKNVVERAVVLSRGGPITAQSLELYTDAGRGEPRDESAAVVETASPPANDGTGLRAELDAVERRRVIEALETCGNNQSRAAKLLGISRHALIARIERFDLLRPRKPR